MTLLLFRFVSLFRNVGLSHEQKPQPVHSLKAPWSSVLCICACLFAIGYSECVLVGNELPKLVRHNNAQGRDEMDSLLFLFYDYYPGCQDAKVLGAVAIYMGLMNLFA